MIQPESPELAGGFFTSEPPRKPDGEYKSLQFFFFGCVEYIMHSEVRERQTLHDITYMWRVKNNTNEHI